MTEQPLNFGPSKETRITTYRVRYTTTAGIVHERAYATIDQALSDSHYPVNARKELFEVTAVTQRRQAISPNWKARKP